jgi:hypothetical protein
MDVPDPPTIEVEVRMQDRLVELALVARVTVRANRFTGATVMMEVALTPAFMVALVGLADIKKS